MKVYILTEGGAGIGFGHITRCLSVYQAFREKGVTPELIVKGKLKRGELADFKRCHLFDWIKNSERLYKMIDGADTVIIDSYLAPRQIYRKVSDIVKHPVFIDDFRRLKYPSGIVVNGSVCAAMLKYPATKGVEYMLGSKYIPIRSEFRKRSARKIRREISKIMITFGGYDGKNMTPVVLKAINSMYKDAIKNVVAGKGFGSIKEIRRNKDNNTRIISDPDAGMMRRIMLDSDIAISAGGQTLYELALTGTPAIGICVSDNQKNNLKGFKEKGFIEDIGWCHSKALSKKLLRAVNKLESKNMRSAVSQRGRRLVDGKGAMRIAEKVL